MYFVSLTDNRSMTKESLLCCSRDKGITFKEWNWGTADSQGLSVTIHLAQCTIDACMLRPHITLPFISNSWSGSAPIVIPHQLWHHLFQRVGYSWTGEVRRAVQWIPHPGPMWHHYVQCHIKNHIQKCAKLAL